jgi:restriction system protein
VRSNTSDLKTVKSFFRLNEATMSALWMVRSAGGELWEEFREKKVVSIHFAEGIGDIRNLRDREAIIQKIVQLDPSARPGKARAAGGMLYRFCYELKIDDWVVTYESSTRKYFLGRITSDYEFRSDGPGGHPHIRRVAWESEISRDELSAQSKNSLGSISTFFQLGEEVLNEMLSLQRGEQGAPTPLTRNAPPAPSMMPEERDYLEELQQRSRELVKDRIAQLAWDEMQELVAGLLRAMGYKTRVSPSGPDQGKDIVASPDGFGFEQPRIVVEVKHRKGAMGSQDIRSFLGGRHKDDKGLYVSTGGFSKDARYEAERSQVPLTLLNIDDLVSAVLEHYEAMDAESKVLLPLRKFYLPV